MKLKIVYGLIVSLILMISQPSYVYAVTDAELEALEKQLDQLESEKLK